MLTLKLVDGGLRLVAVLQLDEASSFGVAFVVVQKSGSQRVKIVGLEEFEEILLVGLVLQIADVDDALRATALWLGSNHGHVWTGGARSLGCCLWSHV